jgi:LETM1-like protein
MAKEQKSNAASRLENAVGSEKEKSVKQEQSAAAMLDFLGRARSGEILPADVIIQFASQFHDDLTLDNMPRMQLINMCRYMNIPPYGGDSFLRFQLRHKIRTLVEDDQRILWEGISSLTKMELREACQERGMRSTGLSKDAYREALQQWLDLSVNKNVPISLLIMSRIFFLSDELKSPVAHDDGRKAVAGLAEAISGLDQDIVNEVVLQVATSEEKKSDPEITKIKLEVIEAQNERILEEQQERAAASKKKEQEKEKQDVQVSANKVSESPSVSEDIGSKDDTAVTQDMLSGESQGKVVDETKNIDDEFLSTQEMDAISQLISADPLTKEREELERIKAAMSSVIHEGDTERTVKNVSIENGDSNIPEKLYIDQSMSEITVIDKKNIERSEAEKMSASTTLKDAEVLNEVTVSTNTAESKVGDAVTTENFDSTSEGEMDSTYASLKARVSRMVVKIESQLESVEEKIGDKLHFLDKDGDGILTLEEMADALQRVLKRSLSYDEAMAIAALMVRDLK